MLYKAARSALLILSLAAGLLSCGGERVERAHPESHLMWGTYLGKDCSDEGFGLAVDGSGCAYVTGFTCSDDFPTTAGAFDRTFNGGTIDAFVIKLDPEGRTLIYSTFLGGSGPDRACGIAVDGSGRALIAGRTRSPDFPVTAGAFDTSANGDYDLFAARLDPAGERLEYATFLGGRFFDNGAGVALDAEGCAYLTGWTNSADFPTTPGAFDRTRDPHQKYADAVVVKLDRSGRSLRYATYLGGGGNDWGQAIAVDDSGRAHVGLLTSSVDFPTTPNAFQSAHGGITDAAAVKLDRSGSGLIYATFLGGSAQDWAVAIAVDDAGRAHLTGTTYAEDFPTTPGAFDTLHHGLQDVFVAGLDPGGSDLIYGTFLGGSDEEHGTGILVSGGWIFLTGSTRSVAFPTTPEAFERSHHGRADAFLAVLASPGGTLAYSSLLGGSADDVARAVGRDSRGRVFVTGWTESVDLPVTPGAIDVTHGGKHDIFVFGIDLGAALQP